MPIKNVARGQKLVFYLPIWNVGYSTDSFLIYGSGDVAGAYTVKYFLGAIPKESLDVTSMVKAGTFSTATLASGAYTGDATMLRVEITVDRHAVSKSTSVVTISGMSSVNIQKTDSVRISLTVK